GAPGPGRAPDRLIPTVVDGLDVHGPRARLADVEGGVEAEAHPLGGAVDLDGRGRVARGDEDAVVGDLGAQEEAGRDVEVEAQADVGGGAEVAVVHVGVRRLERAV